MLESIAQNQLSAEQGTKSGYRTDFFFRKLTKNKEGVDYRYNEVFGHMIREQELFHLEDISWEKFTHHVIPRRKNYFRLWNDLKPIPFSLSSMFSFLFVLFLNPNIGKRNGHEMSKGHAYLLIVQTKHGLQLARVSFDKGAWSFVSFEKAKDRIFEKGEILLYLR